MKQRRRAKSEAPESTALDIKPIDYARRSNPFRQALVQALDSLDAEHGAPGTSLVLAARELILSAVAGDSSALRDLADRLDGKPAQDVALPAGAEMAVQYVVRGPPIMDRATWCEVNNIQVLEHSNKHSLNAAPGSKGDETPG